MLTVTHAHSRFLCACSFEHRDLPRNAGFAWDPGVKRWYTTSYLAAGRLREHCDDAAVKELNRKLITVTPWPTGISYPKNLTPLSFQIPAARFVLERNRSYLAADAGLGKTILAAIIAQNWQGAVLYICPPHLVFNTLKEFQKWHPDALSVKYSRLTKISQLGQNSVLVVPDSLIHRPSVQELLAGFATKFPRRILFVDECFPAGTLVDTPHGPVAIERLRIGDRVLNCTGVDTVSGISSVLKTEAILIVTAGANIVCSASHPFLTTRGWVPAKELQAYDEIVKTPEAVRILQGAYHFPQSAFLRDVLRCEISLDVPGLHSKAKRRGAGNIGAHAGSAAALAFGANAVEESYALRKNAKKSIGNAKKDGVQTVNPWRKWNRAYKNRSAVKILTRSRVENQFSCEHFSIPQNSPSSASPLPLQNRFGFCVQKISRRVRRLFARRVFPQSSGPKKRKVLSISRLDSFALQELGYSREYGGYRFYDISVKSHPSFSVEGLVVHNCHRHKSPKAQRSKALYDTILPHFAEKAVFLSGTPMPNRPLELYPVLSKAAPETIEFMSEFQYAKKYCAAHKTDFGWDFSGASNTGELARRVKEKFMLRLRKKDVLKDLPPKTEEMVFIGEKLPPRVTDMEKKILAVMSPADLVKGRLRATNKTDEGGDLHIATYRRELGLIKAKEAARFIENLLDESETALVVFAVHKDVISFLQKALARFSPLVIVGDTPMALRHEYVETFQTNKARRLFIGNIQAAGTGITLTKATHVVFAEFSWVPGDNDQASDRCHRIGTVGNVLCQYLVYDNSLDRTVLETVFDKRRVIAKL